MDIGVTRDLVGVNGIDPDRQGIKTRSIAFPDSCRRKTIVLLGDRLGGSIGFLGIRMLWGSIGFSGPLANRVNAIEPYRIFHRRSHSK